MNRYILRQASGSFGRKFQRRNTASTSFSIASLSAPDKACSAAFQTHDGSWVSYPNGSSAGGTGPSFAADDSSSVLNAVLARSPCLDTRMRFPSGRNPTSSRPDPKERPSVRCSAPGFDLTDWDPCLLRDRRFLDMSMCPCCAEASRGLPSVGGAFRRSLELRRQIMISHGSTGQLSRPRRHADS